ncbi:hypothetical protein B5M45_30405 [Mycobacterium simiae]|nr:hypothetical protein B5M45_30405 [Mycobacterium simiae]
MRLSVDYVSDRLDATPQSIRQDVAAGGAEGFPAPDLELDRKNYWRPATLYDFIDASRPHFRTRIPRLYPLPSSFRHAPAAFLGAEPFEVGKGTWCNQGVLHFWQPADDRGRVIVAYPDQTWSVDVARDLAALIAGQHTDVSTVVVVTDSESRTPDPEHPDRNDPRSHRGIGVWDSLGQSGDGPESVGREYFSWSDLAYLLRTDVPYWPSGLLDMDAMAAWRPGEVRKIAPRYQTQYQIKNFSAALVDACKDDSVLLRLLGRACRIINYATAQNLQLTPLSVTTMTSETGLLVAGVPDIDPVAPDPLTDEERAELLHLPANPRYAESALFIGSLGDGSWGYWGLWQPILGCVTTIDRNQLGPLAQRWHERLRPLTALRRTDELGFTSIYSTIDQGPDRYSPRQCLHDPLQPDSWIVETPTRIYATTGSQLRHATGRLKSIEIGVTPGQFKDSYPAFVADENSTSWIMPTPHGKAEPYPLGYDGSGARGMAIAVRELCADINTLLSGNDQFAFTDDWEEPCPLRDTFIDLNAPLTLHRNDIDRLLNLVP